MAGRANYYRRYNPSTGTFTRRRKKSRRVGALAGLGTFGQTGTLKATFSSIKGVVITGVIAAGGAVTTDRVFAMMQKRFGLEGYQAIIAKMATGIALGLLVAKILKKPQLGAAFAIGPIVSGVSDIVNALTTPPGEVEGMGYITSGPAPVYDPASMYAGDLGAVQVGTGTPPFIETPAFPFANAAG